MNYTFTSELWLYNGQGSWHFMTLPEDISKEIKENFSTGQRGFGSIRVKATINGYSWNTSLFPDSKRGVYLIPIKADVRKETGILAGGMVNISIYLLV